MRRLTQLLAYLSVMLDEEYHRINLWYFVAFIAGILYYFSIPYEPNIKHVSTAFIASFSTLWLRKYGPAGILLSGILIAFAYGVFVSKYRETSLGAVALHQSVSVTVKGDVASIKPTTRGIQIVLSNVKCHKYKLFPTQIRLNIKDELTRDLMIGDRIKVFAFLNPPARSVLPGGYDFGLYAYFSGIGATGYGLSKPIIISKQQNHSFNRILQDIRRKVYYRLVDVMGSDEGNFTAAILLGEGSGLDRNIMQNMRLAGISHILCVSGLHLSLVAMLFFTSARIFLNLSDTIAFRFNIKSIAAIISLIGSFIYLLVSGSQIAATRAFIMTAIFIFSIIIGRSPYPLRSMGIAAMVILSMNPEYIMHPSFQLSFVAVLSLISGYEFYVRNQWIFGNAKGVFATIKLHFFSNIYSSLVASAATTPIVIYHFYISSNYSILANLIAVPVMSFFMMPLAIIATILMPIHMDYYILKLLGYGVNLVIKTADYVTNMPGSIWYFGYITPFSLTLFMLGFFWVALWQKSWRYFGWGIIIISSIFMFLSKKPDLIFDNHINAVGIQNNDNELEVHAKRLSKFTKNYWANWFGQKDIAIHKDEIKENIDITTSWEKHISILYDHFHCDGDFIINTLDDRICSTIPTINQSMLKEYGTFLIFCDKEHCHTQYSNLS